MAVSPELEQKMMVNITGGNIMSQQLELCILDILKTREKIKDTHGELLRIERMFFDLFRKYNKEEDSNERIKILEGINDCFTSLSATSIILKECNENLDNYYGKFCRLYKEYARMS